jgi:hypothetical protein
VRRRAILNGVGFANIRFPLIDEGYLRNQGCRVMLMAPAEEAEWMEGVLAETLRAQAVGGHG